MTTTIISGNEGPHHGGRKHVSGQKIINIEENFSNNTIKEVAEYMKRKRSDDQEFDRVEEDVRDEVMEFFDFARQDMFVSQMKNFDRNVHHMSKKKENAKLLEQGLHQACYSSIISHSDVYLRQFSLSNRNSFKKFLRNSYSQATVHDEKKRETELKKKRDVKQLERIQWAWNAQMFPITISHSLDDEAHEKIDRILEVFEKVEEDVSELKKKTFGDFMSAMKFDGVNVGKCATDGVKASLREDSANVTDYIKSIAAATGFDLGSGMVKGLIHSFKSLVDSILTSIGLNDNPLLPSIICCLIIFLAWQSKASKKKIMLIVLIAFGVLYAYDQFDAVSDLFSTIGVFFSQQFGEFDLLPEVPTYRSQMFSQDDIGDALGAFLALYLFPKENISIKNIGASFKNFDSTKRNFTSALSCITSILQKVLDIGATKFGFNSFTILSTCVPEVDNFTERVKKFLEDYAMKRILNNIDTYKNCSRLEDEAFLLLSRYGNNRNLNGVNQVIRAFSNKLSKLRVELEMAGVCARKTRTPPLILVFSGGSQIGKSTLIRNFVYALLGAVLPEADLPRLKTDFDSFLYARQPEHEFWDGYFGQMVCIFDELHLVNNKLLSSNNAMTDLIRCGNEFPNSLYMAGLEQKGNTYFRSEIIVCTTNTVDQQKAAQHAVSYPEAVVNRFHFDLKTCVSQEYATAETVNAIDPMNRKLDMSKLPRDGSYCWDTLEFVRQIRVPIEEAPGRFEYANDGVYNLKSLLAACVRKMRSLSKKAAKIPQNDFVAGNIGAAIRQEFESQMGAEQSNDTRFVFAIVAEMMATIPTMIINGIKSGAKQALDFISPRLTLQEANAKVKVDPDDIELFYDCIDGAREDTPAAQYYDNENLGYFTACAIAGKYDEDQIRALARSEPYSKFFQSVPPPLLLDPAPYMRDMYPDTEVLGLFSRAKGRQLFFHFIQRITDHKKFFSCVTYEDFTHIITIYGEELGIQYNDTFDSIRFELKGFLIRAGTAISKHYEAFYLWIEAFSRFGRKCTYLLMSKLTSKTYILMISSIFAAFVASGWAGKFFSEYIYGNKGARAEGFFNGYWTGSYATADAILENYDVYEKLTPEEEEELRLQEQNKDPLVSQMYDPNLEDISKKIWSKNYFQMTQNGDVLGYGWFSHGKSFNFCTHFVKVWQSRQMGNEKVILRQMGGLQDTYEYSIQDFINRSTHLGSDLSVIKLEDHHAYSDIRKFMVSNQLLKGRKTGRCVMFRHTPSGLVKEHMDFKVEFNQVHSSKCGNTEAIAIGISYETDTKCGECGSPVFIIDPSTRNEKFLGFHVAGSGHRGLASTFTIVKDDDVAFTSEMFDFVPKTMQVMGHVKRGPGTNGRTNHIRSKLYGAWGPAKKAPARLLPFKNAEGVRVCPMTSALMRYDAPLLTYEGDFVKACVNAAVSDMVSVMRFDKYGPRKRSLDEVVFGVPGEKFMDSIPRDTSAGLWWSLNPRSGYKGKERFFGKGLDLDFSGPDWEQLKLELVSDENKLLSGTRPDYYYGDALKDELVSLEKAAIGKTRLFCPSPISLYILFNMYFKDFFRLMMDYRISNESAVGINVYSEEWDVLARKLCKFGDNNIVAGDFGSFDALQSAQVLQQIGESILIHFVDREYDVVRRLLWCEIWNSKHVIGKTILVWLQSLPSGNPATTNINTIFVKSVMRMAYVHVHDYDYTSLEHFKDFVSLIAYGDDHALGISDVKLGVFNQHTITEAMTALGLIYTAEDKKSDPPPSRNITEIEFLKRRFRYDDRVARYCAPLRMETVLEMSYWTKRENTEEITRTNFAKAMSELSMHESEVFETHAPEMYTKARDIIGYVPSIVDRNILFDIALKMESRY